MSFEEQFDDDHEDLEMSEFTKVECAECGILFYIPAGYADARRSTRKPFRCPSGHTIRFKLPVPIPTIDDTSRLNGKIRIKERIIARQTHQIDQLMAEVAHLKKATSPDTQSPGKELP